MKTISCSKQLGKGQNMIATSQLTESRLWLTVKFGQDQPSTDGHLAYRDARIERVVCILYELQHICSLEKQ